MKTIIIKTQKDLDAIKETDDEIKCGKLLGGEIAYGDLVETGLEENVKTELEIIELNGVKYKRID